jgi:hypothetical protein
MKPWLDDLILRLCHAVLRDRDYQVCLVLADALEESGRAEDCLTATGVCPAALRDLSTGADSWLTEAAVALVAGGSICLKDVLGHGLHAGHYWLVTHNGGGYRCGYVRVGVAHPWYGQGYDVLDPQVHGGLTFAGERPPKHCLPEGWDDHAGWWLGFDCAHGGDAPDPDLPNAYPGRTFLMPDVIVRTQDYAEAECRSLCEQAAAARGGT